MAHSMAHILEDKTRTDDVKLEEDISFSTMLLPKYIVKGLEYAGFKKPSPIQLAALPLARCGFDLIVQAKSGTGKTLVFAIAALESVNLDLKRAQVIILAPTREIAFQITEVIKTIAKHMKGLRVATLVGGRPINFDKQELNQAGSQILIGCPGRIRHLLELKMIEADAVRLLVLDEADKLFQEDSQFPPDINLIFNLSAESKQVLALSATYPPKMLVFTGKYMRDGRHVTPVGGPAPVLLGLRQMVLITPDHPDPMARLNKKEKDLLHILQAVCFDQCCIFLNYATRAESMNNLLKKKGYASICLTGKQDLDQRRESLDTIRSSKCRILVATDLAARGIDAPSINLVINFDVPWDSATYLHRMGRAGRFGAHGICISLVSNGIELDKFRNLLGSIGGTSMTVNIIPKVGKVDLWNDDLSEFDKIQGVLPPEENVDVFQPPSITKITIIEDKKSLKSSKSGEVKGTTITVRKCKKETNNMITLKELEDQFKDFVLKNKNEEKKKKNVSENFEMQKTPSYSEILARPKKPVPPPQLNDSNIVSTLELSDNTILSVSDVNNSALEFEKNKDSEYLSQTETTSTGSDSDSDKSCSFMFVSEANTVKSPGLDESRKRKRAFTDTSDFDSYTYTIDSSSMDSISTLSGISLHSAEGDFESISVITSDFDGDKAPHSHHCHYPSGRSQQPRYPSQDWYAVISNEIQKYVHYSRKFNGVSY